MSAPTLESRSPILASDEAAPAAGVAPSFLARHRENARAVHRLRGLERELAQLEKRHRLEVLHLLTHNNA